MVTIDFLVGLFGGIIAGVVTVVLVGLLRSPNLGIQIGGVADGSYAHGTFRFVHVRITNKGWRLWRWQIRRAATLCRAEVSFGDLQSSAPRFKIDGRWTSIPEPVHYTADRTIADLGLALAIPREHINPGDHAEVAIALKKDGDLDCFAFNNRSYLYPPNWSNPEWRLERGTYWVRVLVTSGEVQAQGSFYLINTGDLATGLHLHEDHS